MYEDIIKNYNRNKPSNARPDIGWNPGYGRPIEPGVRGPCYVFNRIYRLPTISSCEGHLGTSITNVEFDEEGGVSARDMGLLISYISPLPSPKTRGLRNYLVNEWGFGKAGDLVYGTYKNTDLHYDHAGFSVGSRLKWQPNELVKRSMNRGPGWPMRIMAKLDERDMPAQREWDKRRDRGWAKWFDILDPFFLYSPKLRRL
jgi:hypothetical protein